MAYCGYVTKLKNVREHPNANKMLLADCFGNTVCVGLNSNEEEIVIYFPVDGQLSLDFCLNNNLLRVMPDGTKGPGYMDPDKRNIKAISLRGQKSDGLVCPLSSLAFTGVDVSTFKVGDTITVVNGHEVCKKYIPARAPRGGHVAGGAGSRVKRRAKRTVAPLFFEHKDTEQLAYNLGEFKPGDEIEITLKIHGTSQRTAHVPVLVDGAYETKSLTKGFLLKHMPKKMLEKYAEKWGTPIYDYNYISGTRRTVMDTFEGGFYGSNEFREQHHEFFKGKLWKGETVYYEVAGYTHTGAPIMSTGKTPKEFEHLYGPKMEFSYGCDPNGTRLNVAEGCVVGCPNKPQSHVWVYRMTMTNPDGEVVEYTPDFMRYRCELMGVDCVPVFWRGRIPEHPASKTDDTITAGEWVMNKVEQFYDGPDPIDPRHTREGCVVRIVNRPNFKAYKMKNFCFKVVEGLIKENADAPDMEEAQEVVEEV